MSDGTLSSPQQRVAEAISGLWWLILLRGILLLILGGYALFHPGMTVMALTKVLGIFVLVDGVVAILAGILGWTDSRGWTILRGILGIVIGIFVLGHANVIAGIAAIVIVFVLAAQTIASGILEIIVAIRQRKEVEGEGWLILSGVLSIVFGLILAAAPLTTAAILIGILGVFAICFGIMLIVLAFRAKNVGKTLTNND
jgi:uncharacterized membrane protein HdeD (DUF308 family)